MKRIYRAPQVGTGSINDPITSILNELIDVQAGDHFDEIDHPARKYSICTVTASQKTHDAIESDGRSVALTPLLSDIGFVSAMDTPFADVPQALRDKAKAQLESDGINTAWIMGTNTLRDVLRHLCRMHFFSQIADGVGNAALRGFLTRNLNETVGSLTVAQRTAARNWMQARGLGIGWITNQTTVREVVHYVVENLGWEKIRFGGTEF